MMEQTSSSELEVFFLPALEGKSDVQSADRSINPLNGWESGWAAVEKDLESLKQRARADERKGEPNRESLGRGEERDVIHMVIYACGFSMLPSSLTTTFRGASFVTTVIRVSFVCSFAICFA